MNVYEIVIGLSWVVALICAILLLVSMVLGG